MISKPDKNKIRQRRHLRVRGKISGTAERPRLSVYRSNKNIYAQLIDDVKSGKTKTEQASGVGALIAKRANEKNITEVVFDRGGYLYHGRVQALAEAARENGLKF